MKLLALAAIASLLSLATSHSFAGDRPSTTTGGSDKVVRETLVLKKGGTPDEPAIFDGEGMTVDLGVDMTDRQWKKDGDVWTSVGPLVDRESQEAGSFPGLFVDELPIVIPRDKEAEKQHPELGKRCYVAASKLQPGQMGYAADGSVYFRWPASKSPESSCVLLPPKTGTSCVVIACSHIIVRNITAMHASNDGFNIHGKWVGIRIENVRAFSNGDEGISAHDDVQMDVENAEVAFNASTAGGIADVNRCTTTYRNCIVHDNLAAAFFFAGKSHTVTDTLIYNQSQDFNISRGAEVTRERNEWRK